MTQPSRNRLIAIVFISIVFASIVFLLFRFDRFEIDTDEGINVMKAMLLGQGHSLYSEIWSDQPPVFTYAVSEAFLLFGYDVNVARAFVIFMSFALLWGAWRFLRQTGGPIHAAVGTVLIAFAPHYVRLSISAMIGLPSIALAVLSLTALSEWHHKGQRRWLIISGALLGVSVMTKLFTGFLAPVFMAGILMASWDEGGTRRFRAGAIWAISFVSMALILFFTLVGWDNLGQLVESHVKASGVESYQAHTFVGVLGHYALNTATLLIVACIGAILAVRGRRWLLLYPFVWIAVCIPLIWRHSPIWYHHTPLFTIPAGLLAGYMAGEAFRWSGNIRIRAWRTVAIGTLIVFFALLVLDNSHRNKKLMELWFSSTTEARAEDPRFRITDLMKTYAPQSRWAFTPQPMFAFRAGVLMPPNLVLSGKRISTGMLNEQEILDNIQRLNIEQVLLASDKWRKWPVLARYLEENYRLEAHEDDLRLFILNNIPKTGQK